MKEKVNMMTDDELVKDFRKGHSGSESAFKEIYSRYSTRIYLYCRKVLGDGPDADDIFQETFIKFHHSLVNNYEIPSVQFYLLKISRNLCLNHKRDNKIHFVELEDFHLKLNDCKVEVDELNNLINTALDLIPEEHKEAFILQVHQGLSYNEIAEVTNVPVSTVRNRVVRAKSKIREILLPYFDICRV
jgi:RNA polymerase sigma-70 factor (ECF subfamily)